MLDSEEFSITFGESLRKIRKAKDFTQQKLADAADTSTTIISDYENAKKRPSLLYAKALAEALNVTVDNLCGEDHNSRYVKELERRPIVALITVIKLFRFRITVLEDGSINLTMPRDRAGYSSTEIRNFFKEYELVQQFSDKADSASGTEMTEQLINHLQSKYDFLPDLPVYIPKNLDKKK